MVVLAFSLRGGYITPPMKHLRAVCLVGLLMMMGAGIHLWAGDSTPAGVFTQSQSAIGDKWFGAELFENFFSKDVALSVPLFDVVILVVLVNIFALFKMARYIMAVSYLFCLKWVFFSNYTKILQESAGISCASMWIFLVCGILTAVLFLVDYFRRD
jgi:hypothetical protein